MAILSTSLSHWLASVPLVTRVFTGTTLVLSSYYLWNRWNSGQFFVPWLTLVPGSSLFYPWTFLISGLVELSIIELLVSLITIPASLRYFERLWGTVETIKFLVVCIVGPNLIAFAFNWIEFIVTRNADMYLYGMQYHGQMSLFISFLVAFTQVIPEHQVQILGFIKARVKRLPMAYLTFSTVMCLLGFQCPYILIQFGWFVSWIYLRFYKRNAGDTVGGADTYGDRSETFSLISWFPPLVHTPLSALGNFVFRLATRFHLIPSSVPSDPEAGYSQVPGGARAEAERRRAMALKALDQRLASSSTSSPPSATKAQRGAQGVASSSPHSEGASKQTVPEEADVADGAGSEEQAR